ncbi:MAG: hypothetical protein AAGG08_12795 [Actinomycetota bacterium]
MIGLALFWGFAASLVFTVVVLLSWRLSPQVWIADVTDGAQRPDITATTIAWTSLVTISYLGGGFVAAWLAAGRSDASFVQAALVAFTAMAIVNLVDLFVVDIAVYLWLRPSWMAIDGIEMPTDHATHVRGAINGFVIAVPASLVAAAVSLAA